MGRHESFVCYVKNDARTKQVLDEGMNDRQEILSIERSLGDRSIPPNRQAMLGMKSWTRKVPDVAIVLKDG